MTHAGTRTLGLDQANSTPYTVILLDLHLPDIDGHDVLQALKADPRHR
jgi:CheY-like chemotaxis protein